MEVEGKKWLLKDKNEKKKKNEKLIGWDIEKKNSRHLNEKDKVKNKNKKIKIKKAIVFL